MNQKRKEHFAKVFEKARDAMNPNTQPSRTALEFAKEWFPGEVESVATLFDRAMLPERLAAEKMRAALEKLLPRVPYAQFDTPFGRDVKEAYAALAEWEQAKEAKK